MYYLISHVYAGPNPAQCDPNAQGNRDYYVIQTVPGTTNMSHEELIDGWLGTTNDWSLTAHGEFPTLEEARDAITVDVREWWEGSLVPGPDDAEGLWERGDEVWVEVWVEANVDAGTLLTVDWDEESIEVQLADGVECLFSEDPGHVEIGDVWRAVAEALDVDPQDEREQIAKALDALGWVTEVAADVGWDAYYVVGRPGARPGDEVWESWRASLRGPCDCDCGCEAPATERDTPWGLDLCERCADYTTQPDGEVYCARQTVQWTVCPVCHAAIDWGTILTCAVEGLPTPHGTGNYRIGTCACGPVWTKEERGNWEQAEHLHHGRGNADGRC